MFEDVQLGKRPYKYDPRNLKMTNFMVGGLAHFQPRFDFDSGRAPFQTQIWGNDVWANSVKCAQANHILRLERIATKRTIRISTLDVVNSYKSEALRQFGVSPSFPCDPADKGLTLLDNLKNWRTVGFQGGLPPRFYSIFAFGELDPSNPDEIRSGIYNFAGVQLGFWLPLAAQKMNTVWDYNGETGPEWRPGSWGGHAVYSKAYTPDIFRVLTWGEQVRVTNSFLMKYCDEAWVVIDNYDSCRALAARNFNVDALVKFLRATASSVEVS